MLRFFPRWRPDWRLHQHFPLDFRASVCTVLCLAKRAPLERLPLELTCYVFELFASVYRAVPRDYTVPLEPIVIPLPLSKPTTGSIAVLADGRIVAVPVEGRGFGIREGIMVSADGDTTRFPLPNMNAPAVWDRVIAHLDGGMSLLCRSFSFHVRLAPDARTVLAVCRGARAETSCVDQSNDDVLVVANEEGGLCVWGDRCLQYATIPRGAFRPLADDNRWRCEKIPGLKYRSLEGTPGKGVAALAFGVVHQPHVGLEKRENVHATDFGDRNADTDSFGSRHIAGLYSGTWDSEGTQVLVHDVFDGKLVDGMDGKDPRLAGLAVGDGFNPRDVAFDAVGNLVMCVGHRVVVVHDQGVWVCGATDGQAGEAPGEFSEPSAVAVRHDGRIVVGDFANCRLQIV